MYTPIISKLKGQLESMKSRSLLKDWNWPQDGSFELRRTVNFYVTPASEKTLQKVIEEFEKYENLRCIINTDKKSCALKYRISFKRNIYL